MLDRSVRDTRGKRKSRVEVRPTKLLLRCFQSPGDIVMLTAAVRDLHYTYPGRFCTDVSTSCPYLWENNPYVTSLDEHDPEVRTIDCHYSLINRSNTAPFHFLHGYIHNLNEQLGLAIEPTELKGDLHLSAYEKSLPSPVHEITGSNDPYWIVVAGGKYDFTIKWWEPQRYQKVVDHFSGAIRFVQVGEPGHHHPALENVIDLRGQTPGRGLLRLVHHAQGILTPVSLLMHLAAAVETDNGGARPCVVVAGGREPTQWEAYPAHQFLHTIGALPCCASGGCWKSRTFPLGDGDPKDEPDNLCVDVVGRLPRCMDMIAAADVIRHVSLYFEGGVAGYLGGGRHPDALALTEENAREQSERYVRTISRCPETFQGRGIVICAGGRDYFTCAWICVRMLRASGCGLPVQIWHLGPAEIDQAMADLIRPYGVECVDALEVRRRHAVRRLAGWELKPYSILHCPFREVLLLDADNLPLVNPEFLFETWQFKESRALFWPDVRELSEKSPIWRICGIEYEQAPEFESGQLVVDKEACWPALALTMWYNEWSDFFYKYVHGDKDTFLLAFRKLGVPWRMTSFSPKHVQNVLVQHDFDGRPIFQHQQKWTLLGDEPERSHLRFQDEARLFLQELREIWDGRIGFRRFEDGNGARLQPAAWAALTSNVFTYHRVGHDQRTMTFRTNGTVGLGVAAQETYWIVSDNRGRVTLDIFSEQEELTCRLERCADSVWRGRWLQFEQMPIELSTAERRDVVIER